MDFMASVFKKIIPHQNDSKPQTNNKATILSPESDKKETIATQKPRRSVLKEFDPFISDSPSLPKKQPPYLTSTLTKEEEKFEDAESTLKINEAPSLLIPGWQDPAKLGRISPNVGDTSDIEYVEAFESLSSQPEDQPKLTFAEEANITSEKTKHVEKNIENELKTEKRSQKLESSSSEEDVSIKIPVSSISKKSLESEFQIQENIPEIRKIIEDSTKNNLLQENQNTDKKIILDHIFENSKENELEKHPQQCSAYNSDLKELQTTDALNTTLEISSEFKKLNMNDLKDTEKSNKETYFQDPKDSVALETKNTLETKDILGEEKVETITASKKLVSFSTEDVASSEDKNVAVIQNNFINNDIHTSSLKKLYDTDKNTSNASEDIELAEFEAAEKVLNTDLDKKIPEDKPKPKEMSDKNKKDVANSCEMEQCSPQNTINENEISDVSIKPTETISVENDEVLTLKTENTEPKTIFASVKKTLYTTDENLSNSTEDLELAEFETAEKVLNTDLEEKVLRDKLKPKATPDKNKNEVANSTFNSEDIEHYNPPNTRNDNNYRISDVFVGQNETISVENDAALTSMAQSFSKTIDLEESAIVEASDNSKSDISNDSKDTLNQTVNKTLELSGFELESAINVAKDNFEKTCDTKTAFIENRLNKTLQVNNEPNNLKTQLKEFIDENGQIVEPNEVKELNKLSEAATSPNILTNTKSQNNVKDQDPNITLNKDITTDPSKNIYEDCQNHLEPQEELAYKTNEGNKNNNSFKDSNARLNVLNSTNSVNTESRPNEQNSESFKNIFPNESHSDDNISPLIALNQTHTTESLNAAPNNDSSSTLEIESSKTKNFSNSTQDQGSPISSLKQINNRASLNTTQNIENRVINLNETVNTEYIGTADSPGKIQNNSETPFLNQTNDLEYKCNKSSELGTNETHTTSLNATRTFNSPIKNLNHTHTVDNSENTETATHSETCVNQNIESSKIALAETHNMDFIKLNARKSYRESLNVIGNEDSPKLKVTKTVQEHDVMVDSLEGPILEKKESLDNEESKNEKQDIDSEKIMADSLEGPVVSNETSLLKSKSPFKSSCNISLKEILTSSAQNFIEIETKNQNGKSDLNKKTDNINKEAISEDNKEKVVVVNDPELVKKAEKLEHELQVTKKNCIQNIQFAEKYRTDIQKYQIIMAEYEQQIAKQDRELEVIKQENDLMGKHFSNLELAFSDVFQKYEKAKHIVEKYRQNEDNLAKMVLTLEQAVKRSDAKYEQAKKFLEQEVDEMNKKVTETKERYETEIASLKTKQKMYEIKCLSLETNLNQKTEECQQLAALCDDITGHGE